MEQQAEQHSLAGLSFASSAVDILANYNHDDVTRSDQLRSNTVTPHLLTGARTCFGYPIPQKIDSLVDASSTVPFNLVPCFDHGIVIEAIYVARRGSRQFIVFRFEGSLFHGVPALSTAVIYIWRQRRGRTDGLPENLSASSLVGSVWLLCRIGAAVVPLNAAKRSGVIACGGCTHPTLRSVRVCEVVPRLPALLPPFETHYAGAASICATVIQVRLYRGSLQLIFMFRDQCYYTVEAVAGAMQAVLLSSIRERRNSAYLSEEKAPGTVGTVATKTRPVGWLTSLYRVVESRDNVTLRDALLRGAFNYLCTES